jgi:putative peptidoglycan lipid II flippase
MRNFKKLLGPISIISIAYLMSRIFGFIREILLARWTGVSSATDTLDLAFVIPDFLFYLSAGGYLAITLIPILSKFQKDKLFDLNNYFLSLLNGLSIIFAIFSIIFFIFRYEIGEVFGVIDIELFVRVFTPIIFSQVFFFSGAVMMAYQYFMDEFKYAALAPVIYNLSIIFFGWINSSSPESTIYGFAIGGFIGSFIGHIVVQIYGLKKLGLDLKFIKPKLEDLTHYFKVSIPLIVGQSIAVMDEQLFRIFGSMLSVGAIASFRYARRIAILPVGVMAQAVGVATFPTMSNLFVSKKFDELKNLIRQQVAILYFVNLAIVLVLITNNAEIISLVYERGEFNSSDVFRVSSIMSIVAFGILPWSLNQIVTRAFYVQTNYWYPVMMGTSSTVLATLIILNVENKSEISYAIIIIGSLFLYSLILLTTLKIDGERILNKDLISDLIFSSVVYFVTFGLLQFLPIDTFGRILYIFISTTIIASSFIVSVRVIKMKYVKINKVR